jgi:hypothetical protein
MTPFDLTVLHITQKPTMLYGLKFFPSLEPHCSNDQDSPNWGWPTVETEVSDGNLKVVTDAIQKLGAGCTNVVEIGVHRNEGRSITNILMDTKPSECRYLGVDMADKRKLDNPARYIYTLRANSHDKVSVRSKMRTLGMKTIDLLMIDGWHSVHTCVNDWGYVDMLSPHGVVLLHDTNAHPGCVALYEAVDDNLFVKTRHCTELTDMGIATFWHRK